MVPLSTSMVRFPPLLVRTTVPQDMKLSNLISPLPPQPSHIWHLVMSVSAIYIMIIKANSHLPIGIGNVIRSLEPLSLSTIMSELYRPFNQLVSSKRRTK